MIRQAEKTDRQALAKLIIVILKDMELPLLEQVSEAQILTLLEEAIMNPDYRYGYKRGIVYEQDGVVAGAAFGYPDEDEPTIDDPLSEVLKKHRLDENLQLFVDKETFPNEWYLDTICVDEDYRGHGIGSKLLAVLPEITKEYGKSKIGLNVDQANPLAKKLYERDGFKVIGEVTISGHLYEHMQKKIGDI